MGQELSKWLCPLSDLSPTYSSTTQQPGLPAPYYVTGVPRQRNMAKMKEQIKTPGKELSDEEIANLSEAQFKTLVIRMLIEMVESMWSQNRGRSEDYAK